MMPVHDWNHFLACTISPQPPQEDVHILSVARALNNVMNSFVIAEEGSMCDNTP
jgi:hypothetical protein